MEKYNKKNRTDADSWHSSRYDREIAEAKETSQ